MGMRQNEDIGLKWYLIGIISVISLLGFLMLATNSCSASDWNDGICPNCNVRYELRGAAGDLHLKYYVCPECGKEVERY
jgi:predicted RNA-binding Zn-ribbon protein involved in translation (DUF1610 family)